MKAKFNKKLSDLVKQNEKERESLITKYQDKLEEEESLKESY